MVYKKILRWVTLVGLPISILLFFVDVLFRIQHWARLFGTAAPILMLTTLVCAWQYAVLVGPARSVRPSFDFGEPKA